MSSGRPRHARARSVTLAAAVAVVGAVALPGGAAHASVQAPAVADFNGDGHADLAVGAPGGTISGKAGAGYVSVVYGATGGVDAARHADFSQNTAGVPGAAEAGDRFGAHVLPVDLNRDGFTDLLVGAPGEDVGSVVDAGMITVLWGGAQGLSTAAAVDTGAPRAYGRSAWRSLRATSTRTAGSTSPRVRRGRRRAVGRGHGRQARRDGHHRAVAGHGRRRARRRLHGGRRRQRRRRQRPGRRRRQPGGRRRPADRHAPRRLARRPRRRRPRLRGRGPGPEVLAGRHVRGHRRRQRRRVRRRGRRPPRRQPLQRHADPVEGRRDRHRVRRAAGPEHHARARRGSTRTAPACPASRRRGTRWARTSRWATSTATGTRTWWPGCRARTSTASPTRAPSCCSRAVPRA